MLTDEQVTESRADVCRVAEALFARHGVEGVTMRQIAAELAWSPTTAYRYFKNKEEILVAVRAAAFNRFCGVIEAATRSNSDPRKSARAVGTAYVDFALANPAAYRMMFDISQAEATSHQEFADALARARRSMVAYVAPLIHGGILRGDAQAMGQMLWASAHGLVMLRLSGIVTDDAELRRLHETTMSALVRGAHQTIPAKRGTGAVDASTAVSPRNVTRRKH
jgi:AcrR family transcriptional regulator